MGLMYIFPNDTSDTEHVEIHEHQIRLRTYGLPPIFWGYGIAILIMIGILALSIWGPVQKLLSYNDPINDLIGHSLIAFLILLPLVLISFFFYEKNIIKKDNTVDIVHRLFFIPVFTKTYKLADNQPFFTQHYLDSPNMARAQGLKEMRGFQNKGHFLLYLRDEKGLAVQIDRSSRKIDLEKIIKILS